MFTRHSTEFANITSVQTTPGAMVSLSAETIVECRRGWTQVRDLRPSDDLATLDGGFVPMAWIRRALPTPAYFVPAKALGNCTDVVLPADSHIGFDAPIEFEAANTDTLSLPLSALDGWRGVRQVLHNTPVTYTVGLAAEEMLWAQTGMLIHAQPMSQPWFHTLTPAQTRNLLAMDPSQSADVPQAA